MIDIHVGRQPIYDRSLKVVAYELLFGVGDAGSDAGEEVSTEALVNAFVEIGLDRLSGEKPAYLRICPGLLGSDHLTALPPERVVLEIADEAEVSPGVLEAVRSLRRDGYRFALDRFVYRHELWPLLELCDVVKIDVAGLDRATVHRQVAVLRDNPMTLLAERVETHEDIDFCRTLPFELFQGQFFCRPRLIQGRRIPPSRASVLRLIAELQRPEVSFSDLEEIVATDLPLSHKVLRCVNSAGFAMPKRIDSLRQALTFLGVRTILTWATLIAMAGVSEKPHELVVTAMVRAKMCETLARAQKASAPEQYFTVGLLSVLDALLDAPMDQVLRSLPMADEIDDALLNPESAEPLAVTLRSVLAYERGDWDFEGLMSYGTDSIREAYVEAVAWATNAASSLAA